MSRCNGVPKSILSSSSPHVNFRIHTSNPKKEEAEGARIKDSRSKEMSFLVLSMHARKELKRYEKREMSHHWLVEFGILRLVRLLSK